MQGEVVMSKAVMWTRQRNPTKRRLMGLRSQLERLSYDPILTFDEQTRAHKAMGVLDDLLYSWPNGNEQSKEYYIKRMK